MSKIQRIRNVIFGLLMIILSLIMGIIPKVGINIAIFILCITLIFIGLRFIRYYITMARYMVGGKTLLVLGVTILDLGLFALAMSSVPLAYIMLYLIISYAFSGVIDILRALEARSYDAPSWKFNFSSGAINVAVAILALLFGTVFRSPDMVTYIFSAGLFYSGVTRIISAFRRTAIVYIN